MSFRRKNGVRFGNDVEEQTPWWHILMIPYVIVAIVLALILNVMVCIFNVAISLLLLDIIGARSGWVKLLKFWEL